jgi:hypothetical protein
MWTTKSTASAEETSEMDTGCGSSPGNQSMVKRCKFPSVNSLNILQTQTFFNLSENSWVFESMTNATILQNEWRDRQDPKINRESEAARAERHERKSRYHYQVNNRYSKPDGNESP